MYVGNIIACLFCDLFVFVPFKYNSSLKIPNVFINISLSYCGWYLAGF